MAMRFVSMMSIVLWAHILQLVHRAALGTSLDRPFSLCSEPDDDVGVYWAASAANVLFGAEAFDDDRIFNGAYTYNERFILC